MDGSSWQAALAHLPLGELYFFDRIGSTNDFAARLLARGEDEFSLVTADFQFKGRGRIGRSWLSRPGTGLTFSLILRDSVPADHLPILSGWAAVGVCCALQDHYQLPARIKWPNDILISGKKAAGILIENHWEGSSLKGVVVGIGINVAPGSVPEADRLRFPATCLECELGREIQRPRLLAEILRELLEWIKELSGPALLETWQRNLAFRGEKVCLTWDHQPDQEGILVGLEPDGALVLRVQNGREISCPVGEITLRPVDRNRK